VTAENTEQGVEVLHGCCWLQVLQDSSCGDVEAAACGAAAAGLAVLALLLTFLVLTQFEQNNTLCWWCLPQVLQDSSCGDVWKLQLVELLLQDWLLLPHQAVQLLGMFDRCAACTQQAWPQV
jgi:hypothetical protein